MEALQQGAEKLGLNSSDARKLALATFRGASELAAQSADPPATLRAQVTSKAGTTEAAIAQMERNNIKNSIVDAVGAAAARGRELGDELGSRPAASMPAAK